MEPDTIHAVYIIIISLATPSIGKLSVSVSYGKKIFLDKYSIYLSR